MSCGSLIPKPQSSKSFSEIERANDKLPKSKKRIPRKLKKKFKTLWFKRDGVKLKIYRASVKKTIWDCGSNDLPTWGCVAYPINK